MIFTTLENDHIAAVKELEEARNSTGGLICRWDTVNRAVLKAFRFKNIYFLAGASGAGKSFILNMLKTDFTDTEDMVISMDGISDELILHLTTKGEFKEVGNTLYRPALNANLNFIPIIVSFSLEMAGTHEYIRTICTIGGYSFDYLMSANVISKPNIYNRLTDEEISVFSKIGEAYIKTRNDRVITTKGRMNRMQIRNTLIDVANQIEKIGGPKPYKIIATLDHTLLVSRYDEKNDLELQNELIKEQIALKEELDDKLMTINLGQFNNEIEDIKRRTVKELQFPVKSDIYMGGMIYQGADYVALLYCPSYLGIGKYGLLELPTIIAHEERYLPVLHLSWIKTRFGTTGQSWLASDLSIGKIRELEVNNNNGFSLIN